MSALVGTCIAIELARQPEARRRWMMTLLGLPLAFSGLVIAYGFILAFGRAGFVTQLLAGLGADPAAIGSWIYSVSGLGFAYAYYLIPRVALSLYPVFANLDLRPAQAARTLGASKARAFRDTVVPEVLPSVLSNACMVAAIAMGTYGTALALVGTQLNILPLMLLAQVGDGGSDFAVAAALSLVLMVILLLPPAAYAQDVDEDYIMDHLGPAAEEMEQAGIDGSGEDTPDIIWIAQRWSIAPAAGDRK